MFFWKKKKAGVGDGVGKMRQKLLFPEIKLESGLYTELLEDCRVVENGAKCED